MLRSADNWGEDKLYCIENMKRRTADCGKLRRPLKKSKITDGIYGSTFVYVKFLLVWGLVLMADFILEFRFEYLWPFWLLLRSVYDSFKYQGLAFSVFFVCVAITSDVICYLFIPVQWLFFAASTYVWVQYVWHTERGICLPTVSLWLLFVYMEASVRLREFKSLPFHLDLCRPFAAHCIGYPVVTLGFGFKSYVSYRMRVRKQRDVQKENEFYVQLLQQALPAEPQQNNDKQKALPSKAQEDVISNGVSSSSPSSTVTPSTNSSSKQKSSSSNPQSSLTSTLTAKLSSVCGGGGEDREKKTVNHSSTPTGDDDYPYIEQNVNKKLNDYQDENSVNDTKNNKANGVAFKTSSSSSKLNTQKDVSTRKGKSINTKETTANNTYTNNKDEVIVRLEGDIKRLKADLQTSRNCEQELRCQINNLVIGDKSMKSELYQLRQDNENLQNKLHNLVMSRQQDKQNMVTLERKLLEEQKNRKLTEQQLTSEKNKKKAEDQARAVAMASTRGECLESCKVRRKELENEVKQIRRELKVREDQIRQLERETQSLRKYKEAQNETEVLMSALSAMQDKNTHLENSLSAETRVKLDLFSALGEAKRQLEIHQGLLHQKDQEIADLKSKVAEVMALMPDTSNYHGPISPDSVPSSHFSNKFVQEEDVLSKSSLNPNASDYTPISTK